MYSNEMTCFISIHNLFKWKILKHYTCILLHPRTSGQVRQMQRKTYFILNRYFFSISPSNINFLHPSYFKEITEQFPTDCLARPIIDTQEIELAH